MKENKQKTKKLWYVAVLYKDMLKTSFICAYTKEEAKEITEKYNNGIYKNYIDEIYYFDEIKKDIPIGVYTPWHDNYSHRYMYTMT